MADVFLDPKNDVAFKKIFGTEKNKDILIHFLNDILTFKERSPIVDVEFIKTVLDPEIALQKTSIVDILCTDEKKNQYIVEMQVAKTSGFEKRAQFYASRAYSSQSRVGDRYQDLKEVIFLAIVDYDIFPKKDQYKSEHIILDKKTYEQDLEDFSFTFISLPRFTKKLEELVSLEDKWCYFLKNAEQTSQEDLEKIIDSSGILQKAYHELNRFYWNKQELLNYDAAEKIRRDNLAVLEEKLNEGKIEGKMEMARGLLKQGISISIISVASGLSEEKIRSLKT